MTAAPSLDEAIRIADASEAETRYRLQFARELTEAAARREYERGLAEGYVLAIADVKAFQHGLVRDAQLERRRWHLCCRRCRAEGHRQGCADCEDRTRGTFGQSMAAELTPAQIKSRARDSWEPYGLPPPGMVHLGGPVVHHHSCTAACYAYEPGWYAPAQAISIIETLPGNYAESLAELRALGRTLKPGKAAA